MADNQEFISDRKLVKIKLVSVAKMFLLACGIGGAAIILGVQFNSRLLAVVVPLLVMAIYIYSMLRTETDLPTTIIGDSYYYLGFIFTLLALVASLVSLAANNDVNMNSIVGSFGAALSTTIVGLIARLLVTSFSVQAEERRERLENQIEKSLITFSAQLDTLTQQVVSSITKVHAETKNTLDETLNNYKYVNDELVEQYRVSMKEGEKAIYDSMTNLSSRIEAIDVSLDLVSKPLGASLAEILDTLKRHQEQYEIVNKNMMIANSKLSGQFKQSGIMFYDHATRLETVLAKVVQKQGQSYEKSLSKIGESITSLGDIKELRIDAEESINTRLGSLGMEIDAIANGIRGLKDPSEKSSIEIVKGGGRMGDSLGRFSDGSEKLNRLVEKTGKNAEKVSEGQGELDSLACTVKDFTSELRSSIGVNQVASQKINGAATATEEYSVQVAKDIVMFTSNWHLRLKHSKRQCKCQIC